VLTFTDSSSRRPAPKSDSDDDSAPTFNADAGRDQSSPTTIAVLASAAPTAAPARIPRVLVLPDDLPPRPPIVVKRRKTALTQGNLDSAKIYKSPPRFTSAARRAKDAKAAARAAAKLEKKEQRKADAARLAYQSSDVLTTRTVATINSIDTTPTVLPLRLIIFHLPDIFITT
jgi:hypothetical protein